MKKRIFVVAVCESETSGEAAESTQKVEQTEPLTGYLNDFDAVIPDLFKEKTGYDVEVVTGNGAEGTGRWRGLVHKPV